MPDIKKSTKMMTKQMIVAEGAQFTAALTGMIGASPKERMAIIQWGKQAFREGEPAHMTGKFRQSHPDRPTIGGFFAEIEYEDGVIKLVDTHLPRYGHGRTPPWILPNTVYVSARNPDGATVQVPHHVERRSDREHWLEIIAESKCRRSLKVREGVE